MNEYLLVYLEKRSFMNRLSNIIKDIESGIINENSANGQGVIVVDSIETFMLQHNATHLRDLDNSLGINGTN